MSVKFREVGNSMTITIPRDIVLQLGIVKGNEANIELYDNGFIVEPIVTREKVTIKSLFKKYNGTYKSNEIDWGNPKGREIW